MKIKSSIFFGVVSALTIMTACSPNNKAGESKKSEGKISGEISYGIWDKKQQPYIDACIAEFNKLYPDVKINVEVTPFADYWMKLETAATSGTAADVFWMNGPNITKYAKGGVIAPIDDLLKNSDVDLANYSKALVSLYNIDNKQYAIPKDFDTIGVWYNKELFDQAGVPYPTNDWTWEDMVAIAKQLTKSDKSSYGIAAQYRDHTGIYNTIYANSGYVISEDKKTSGYDKPETQAGIQCWVDLQEAGVSPSEASLEETEDYVQFLSGNIAMHWDGSWFLNQVLESDLKDKIGVVELPSINGKKATVIHGLGNCISSKTKNPEAAWKWVEFLASKKASEFSAIKGAAIPAYNGTAQLWVDSHKEYDLGGFIKAVDYSYMYPASLNTSEWIQYQSDNFKKAFSLETSVKDAADNLAKQMNEVLKNEN